MTLPRILLVDDHAMFRSGLSLVLSAALPHADIVQAGRLADAVAIPGAAPSLVLLDVQLAGESGLDGLSLIHKRWPSLPVLMLSALDDPETMRYARARGATGFVSKAQTAQMIVQAVESILDGSYTYGDLDSGSMPLEAERSLTPRQREVLQFVHLGMSNKVIARKLDLSDNTVRRHVQDILETLQVKSRMEAVIAARAKGLVF